MPAGRRAGGQEYAARVNAAAALLASGVAVADAARGLAPRFDCSPRQARRYVERAVAAGGPVAAPPATTVFTVKLPLRLAARVRAHAAATGRTLSGVVAQALEEFLARAGREHPRQ